MTARAKTGERRQVNQPLKIDLLPEKMRDRILTEHNTLGRPWEEIEMASPSWDEWDKVNDSVLKLFPKRRLPHSTLHRWYDLRVSQVRRDVMAQAEQSREIAAVFAKASVDGGDEAVLNAARDLIFGLLQQGGVGFQFAASKALIALGEVMQASRANQIKERKVAVDERKLKALEAREELRRRKLETETQNAAKKLSKGGAVTVEDINRLRERTFGLPPIAKH